MNEPKIKQIDLEASVTEKPFDFIVRPDEPFDGPGPCYRCKVGVGIVEISGLDSVVVRCSKCKNALKPHEIQPSYDTRQVTYEDVQWAIQQALEDWLLDGSEDHLES